MSDLHRTDYYVFSDNGLDLVASVTTGPQSSFNSIALEMGAHLEYSVPETDTGIEYALTFSGNDLRNRDRMAERPDDVRVSMSTTGQEWPSMERRIRAVFQLYESGDVDEWEAAVLLRRLL